MSLALSRVLSPPDSPLDFHNISCSPGPLGDGSCHDYCGGGGEKQDQDNCIFLFLSLELK